MKTALTFEVESITDGPRGFLVRLKQEKPEKGAKAIPTLGAPVLLYPEAPPFRRGDSVQLTIEKFVPAS